MKKVFFYLVIGLVLYSCENYTILETPEGLVLPQGESIGTMELVQSNNKFAIDLFTTLSKEDSVRNIFLAPLSVSTALAMTYSGSAGDSEDEIAEVMNWSENSDAFHQSYADYLSEIEEQQSNKYRLKVANRLFIDSGLELYKDFLDVNKNNYQTAVEVLDFSNSTATANKINDWVAQETDSMVLDLVNPDEMGDTKMTLVNAVAFEGGWLDIFDANQTRKNQSFDGIVKEVAVDYVYRYYEEKEPPSPERLKRMMAMSNLSKETIFPQKPNYKYTENQNFQVLEMPYASKEASMIIFLPIKKNYDYIRSISLVELDTLMKTLDTIPNGLDHVKVQIPKFKLSYQRDLKEPLEKLGLKKVFTDEASFNRIASQKLKLNKILHKTSIEVNEVGTSAAGATCVEMSTLSLSYDQNILNFIATHPFLYLIKDNKTGTILFVGQFVQPEEKEKGAE